MCVGDDTLVRHWDQIKSLLIELEELAPCDRGARIQAIADADLRREVRRLGRDVADQWLEAPMARWAI